MKPTNFNKPEQSLPIKRKYFPRQIWLKESTIYPPVIVIFGAIFCLVYLLNNDVLYSLYSIPYILVLLIGILWLKYIQRMTVKKYVQEKDNFLLCIAKVIEDKNNSIYAIFSTGDNRHNNYYLENAAKTINLEEYRNVDSKKATKVKGEPDIFITKLPAQEVLKQYPDVEQKKIFPIFYIGKKYVKVIKSKDIG